MLDGRQSGRERQLLGWSNTSGSPSHTEPISLRHRMACEVIFMRLSRHHSDEKLTAVFRACFRHTGVAIGAGEFRAFRGGGFPLHFLLVRIGFDFRQGRIVRCAGLG
jgi:hypothetical protein